MIDADALNIIAEHQFTISFITKYDHLPPHPKEFERLIGKNLEKMILKKLELAREFAKQYQIIVVLKGAHSAVVLPNGQVSF